PLSFPKLAVTSTHPHMPPHPSILGGHGADGERRTCPLHAPPPLTLLLHSPPSQTREFRTSFPPLHTSSTSFQHTFIQHTPSDTSPSCLLLPPPSHDRQFFTHEYRLETFWPASKSLTVDHSRISTLDTASSDGDGEVE